VPTKRVSQNGGPGVGNRERRGTEDVEEFEELSEGGEVFKPESDVECKLSLTLTPRYLRN